MPRALKVCAEPGCPTLVATGRCPTHTRAADHARGSRQDRGYDRTHDRERQRWAPKVQRGEVDCAAPTCVEPARRIQPGEPWDLGHTDDRRGWRGPEHQACNRGWRRNTGA